MPCLRDGKQYVTEMLYVMYDSHADWHSTPTKGSMTYLSSDSNTASNESSRQALLLLVGRISILEIRKDHSIMETGLPQILHILRNLNICWGVIYHQLVQWL